MKKVKIGNRHHFINVFAANEIERLREGIHRIKSKAEAEDSVHTTNGFCHIKHMAAELLGESQEGTNDAGTS